MAPRPCGLLPPDCVTDHWLLPLGGRAEPAGWRAPCPVCGKDRRLSIKVKGGRPVWNVHCGCDRARVAEALRRLVGDCAAPPRRRVAAPDAAAAVAVLYDPALPPAARQVGALRALGESEAEIRVGMKLPRSTYYDAVRILGQSGRPAARQAMQEAAGRAGAPDPVPRKPVRTTGQNPRSPAVRTTGHRAAGGSPNARTSGQVTGPPKDNGGGLTSRGTLSAPAADALTAGYAPQRTPPSDGSHAATARSETRSPPEPDRAAAGPADGARARQLDAALAALMPENVRAADKQRRTAAQMAAGRAPGAHPEAAVAWVADQAPKRGPCAWVDRQAVRAGGDLSAVIGGWLATVTARRGA